MLIYISDIYHSQFSNILDNKDSGIGRQLEKCDQNLVLKWDQSRF